MQNKPKPPLLKEKRSSVTMNLQSSIKARLKMAKAATGLSQGEYVERSLLTQFELDHIPEA
jgi:hypothetical protein